jgi:hypothetical protein
MSRTRHPRRVIDFARANAVLPVARARLFAIPGVHAVGMGRKIVGGEFTDEFAVMVFVTRKRPVARLLPEHVIPNEIDGVKTDVYESDIPLFHAGPDNGDTTSYSVLTGGIQIKPGDFGEADTPTSEPEGLGSAGTLGCFIQVDNSIASQIFAVTNFHVVGKHLYSQPTNLAWTPDGNSKAATRTFSTNDSKPTVTPNTLLAVNVGIGVTQEVNAFYQTGPSDTPADVAGKLKLILNGIGTATGNGLSADVTNNVTLAVALNGVSAGSVQLVGPFGPNRGDNKAATTVTVVQTAVYPSVITITLSGPLYEELGGAYLTIFPGGSAPTYGTFVAVGTNAPAYDIARAINALNINGVTAEPTDAGDTGSVVTVTGAQVIECQFTTDRRVGQADNKFCSWCSRCCDHRIGEVAFARLDLELALIQLDPGKQYQAKIPGIGQIVGTHDIGQDLAAKTPTQLWLRGRTSTTPTQGTLIACNLTGYADSPNCPGWALEGGIGPPPWRMLIRYYQNGFLVQGNGGQPFSLPGDSGAAIVTAPVPGPNGTTTVAGIVFAGYKDHSVGTAIQPILDAVSAWQGSGTTTTLAIDETNQPQTVPTPPGEDPKYRFSPDEPLARVAHRAIPSTGSESARLAQVQSEINGTPGGQRYGPLIMRHLAEAQTLVNANRKMATVWHRNGGPTIVEGLLRMLEFPGQRIPPTINGTPLKDCLQQIASALARYGSDTLAADIKTHSAALIQLAHLTYPELLLALGAADTVPV